MTGRVTPSGPSLAAWAVIVLLFHLVEPVPAATLEGAAQRGLQQFGQHLSEYSQGKRRKADQTTLIRSWQTELGPLIEQLDQFDDETVKQIYSDTRAAVYYTHDPHIAATLPRISRELDSRDRDLDPMRGNPTVGNHRQATYHALINARQFTQAAVFKADQGDGVTLFPALVDAAALAYRNVDWVDLIDLSETPQFYLIRDGKVLRHIKGWPDDTRGHALKDDLREVFGSGMPQRATSQDQPADPDD